MLSSSKVKVGLFILLAVAILAGGVYYLFQQNLLPNITPAEPTAPEPTISLDNTEDLTAAIIAETNSEIFSEELYTDSELVISDEASINSLYQSYDASQL